VIEGGEYPALSEIVTAGVFEPGESIEADFDFGLERTLDGIETFVDR
jgi:hypothetical protein